MPDQYVVDAAVNLRLERSDYDAPVACDANVVDDCLVEIKPGQGMYADDPRDFLCCMPCGRFTLAFLASEQAQARPPTPCFTCSGKGYVGNRQMCPICEGDGIAG